MTKFENQTRNKIAIGDKIKTNFWGLEGDIHTVVEVLPHGICASCDKEFGNFGYFYSESEFEKVYTTPEGTVVSIGDKGVWEGDFGHGAEYILVEGPNPYGEDEPYWNRKDDYGWNPLSCKGYTVAKKEVEQTKEKQMRFTETVTETKIKEAIDKVSTDIGYMSVAPHSKRQVRVVVGAEWKNRCASIF